MIVRLLHPDRDLVGVDDLDTALLDDIGLGDVIAAMARGDTLIAEVATEVLLTPLTNTEVIRYRQQALTDVLAYPEVVRTLYGLAQEGLAREREVYVGLVGRPSSLLQRSLDVLDVTVGVLRRLRRVADRHRREVQSAAFTGLFDRWAVDLADTDLTTIEDQLTRLRLRDGVRLGLRLGPGGRGIDHQLREPHGRGPGLRRLLGGSRPVTGFEINERDDAGIRALGELREVALTDTAQVVAQASADILGFLGVLVRELAFYLGAVHLRDRLTEIGEPIAMPTPVGFGGAAVADGGAAVTDSGAAMADSGAAMADSGAAVADGPGTPPTGHADAMAGTAAQGGGAESGGAVLEATGVTDAGLALRTSEAVVGNDIDTGGAPLVLVTGANQGGKSTFLRSVGLAQLMLQAGLFVTARSFRSTVVGAVFAHVERGEDTSMRHGRLDAELAEMSAIADRLSPGDLLLLNESFSSTNEREGSLIALEIVRALTDAGVRVVYVTHLHDLAATLHREDAQRTVFLRAERRDDRARTYRLLPGAPEPTSYGADLYDQVFGSD